MVTDELKNDWIVIGKGIGFNKTVGEPIAADEIDRRFMAEPSKEFSYIINTIFSIDAEIISVINEMIKQAEKFLHVSFNESSYITIVDHINFALKRTNEGIDYSVPLQWEIKKMHAQEYQAALLSLQFLKQKTGISLPETEEAFITLHYVNAQGNKNKLKEAEKIDRTIREITQFITTEYAVTFEEDSAHYMRFVTHLRYFVIRQLHNEAIGTEEAEEIDEDMLQLVKTKYSQAYQIALSVIEKARKEYGWLPSLAEILYLSIHIKRNIRLGE